MHAVKSAPYNVPAPIRVRVRLLVTRLSFDPEPDAFGPGDGVVDQDGVSGFFDFDASVPEEALLLVAVLVGAGEHDERHQVVHDAVSAAPVDDGWMI